ncbi:MAG: hypothetical protein Q4P36_07215 [Bowdeniella nasicola]|nr:hypothetical protein [Bowdeniella nasicola]
MSCDHCDSSIPHEHDAVPGAVDAALGHARTLMIAQYVITAVVLAASLLAVPLGSWLMPFGWGIATWAAATGIAAMAGTWARSGREVSHPPVAMRSRLVAGVAGALVLVLGAWIAAARADGAYLGGTAQSGLVAWQVALTLAAGWFTAAAILAAVQTYGWRRLLTTPGDGGELVRAGVLHAPPTSLARSLAAFLVPGLSLALWTIAFAWLAWLVLIAIPGQALVAIAMTRR